MKFPARSSAVFTTALAVLALSGCSSTSTADVRLPDGTHCRSESQGFFLWRTTSVACVDAKGNIIGSYSNM
jgi:hypothetical protein